MSMVDKSSLEVNREPCAENRLADAGNSTLTSVVCGISEVALVNKSDTSFAFLAAGETVEFARFKFCGELLRDEVVFVILSGGGRSGSAPRRGVIVLQLWLEVCFLIKEGLFAFDGLPIVRT